MCDSGELTSDMSKMRMILKSIFHKLFRYRIPQSSSYPGKSMAYCIH